VILRSRRRAKSDSGRRATNDRTSNRRALAILLVLGLVIAACAGEGETTTTAGDDTGTTAGGDTGTTTGVSDGPIEISIMVTRPYYIPPDEFQSFMAEYPNITVTWDVQSNDDILQQLLTRVDAGQPLPDVLGAEDSFLVPVFVEAGLVGSHDEMAATWEAEDPDLYNLVWPLVWDETAIDGVKYGASITANFDVLYYNQEWFDEAGVSVPFESLDAVLDAMRAMKATRPDSIPLTVQAKAGDGVTTLKTMLAAAGAPFDGAVFDLTSPGGLYTINWWLQAAAEGLIPPDAIAWGEDESRGAYVSGDAGLILDGFTTAGDFAEAPDFDYPDQWNLTPVPVSQSGGGADGIALAAARTWAVLEGSEHPYEAGLVIRYIAETASLLGQAGNGGVPARQDEMINSPELLEIWPFFNDDLKAAYIGASPQPAGANAGEVEAILEQMFGEIVVGTDKTAEELAAEYQPLLDNA
jgi:multiple sugar transport system substrate-binding protein